MGNSFRSSQDFQTTLTETSRDRESVLKHPQGNSLEYEILTTKNIETNQRIVSHDFRSTTYTVEQNHNSSRKDTVNPTNVSVMNSSLLSHSKKPVSNAIEESDMFNSIGSQFNQKIMPPKPVAISKRKEPPIIENDSFENHKRPSKEIRFTPREDKQYFDESMTRSDKSLLGSKSHKGLEYMNNINTSDFYSGAAEISKCLPQLTL